MKRTSYKLLFIDLETTGLPIMKGFNQYYNSKILKYYNSSRIIQLAAVVYNIEIKNTETINIKNIAIDDLYLNSTSDFGIYTKKENKLNTNEAKVVYNIVDEFNYYIKHDDVKITNNIIHGITDEIIEEKGISFTNAIKNLEKHLDADIVIAHNIGFDRNILLSELYRYNMIEQANKLLLISTFCTSLNTTNVTKILLQYTKVNAYKAPKLSELYKFLFKSEMIGAHDALEDTRNMVKCFFQLYENNWINFIQE